MDTINNQPATPYILTKQLLTIELGAEIRETTLLRLMIPSHGLEVGYEKPRGTVVVRKKDEFIFDDTHIVGQGLIDMSLVEKLEIIQEYQSTITGAIDTILEVANVQKQAPQTANTPDEQASAE
jgi:hypothetical protein